ncbi:MAG: bifunctional enoyl-CoA hydratase/phosphate acetyltransferase, partial [Pseudomonadota bacterium]|nr:bifunctional enoyl-CoA hydratase/phosphate acetyltransferase [Pseudomonadota bacterium]
CDALAIDAAARIADAGIATPVLIGPPEAIRRAADAAGVDHRDYEIVDAGSVAADAAVRAVEMARDGGLAALMKGSLHTDALMSAVVHKTKGLRAATRISHVFLFDLPRYPKLLAVADCVVNIAPALAAKRDIVGNAVALLQSIGIGTPKVAVIAAIEKVNAAIAATLDAQALVAMSHDGAWPGATVEGPLGFDIAISAEAACLKGVESQVAGDVDLLIVPDLNAGNILYKSFVYVGGGECAGLVLGTSVPVVLTSRADSLAARLASAALAVLAIEVSQG